MPRRARGIRAQGMPRCRLFDRDAQHGRPRALAAGVAGPARHELRAAGDLEARRVAAAVGARGHDLLLPARGAGLARADDDRLAALRALERAVDGDLVLARLQLLLGELLVGRGEAGGARAARVTAGARGEQAAEDAAAGGRGGRERVGLL